VPTDKHTDTHAHTHTHTTKRIIFAATQSIKSGPGNPGNTAAGDMAAWGN